MGARKVVVALMWHWKIADNVEILVKYWNVFDKSVRNGKKKRNIMWSRFPPHFSTKILLIYRDIFVLAKERVFLACGLSCIVRDSLEGEEHNFFLHKWTLESIGDLIHFYSYFWVSSSSTIDGTPFFYKSPLFSYRVRWCHPFSMRDNLGLLDSI